MLRLPENEDAEFPGLHVAFGRIWSLIRGMRGGAMRLRAVTALALTIAARSLNVMMPFMFAGIVNTLVRDPRGNLEPALWATIGWIGVRFATAAVPNIRDAIFSPVSEEAQRRAASGVFAHVHTLSLSFHQTKRTGAVFRHIERGVRAMDFLLRFLCFNLGPTVYELTLAAVMVSIKYGPEFALIAALTGVAFSVHTYFATKYRMTIRRQMVTADTNATGHAVDSLLNFETVKSFAAEAREAERYDTHLANYAQAAVRSANSNVWLNNIQSLIMNAGMAAMVIVAVLHVSAGRMSIGDITAVVMLITALYGPLGTLGAAYRQIKNTTIDMETMFGLLDIQPDVADAPGAAPLAEGPGEVAFEHVSFNHDARKKGLQDISFVAPAGRTTAIVGPSGAGKSTVLKLLFRFYDPQQGRVLFDGQDVRDVTQESLRSVLGLVPQDVVLFNDTIRFNIAYGRPDATQAELEEAARRAHLLDFIEHLPEGWETPVGERGLKISGGEKQRIGIARVILKNPKILILDEATSSLDTRTEREVQTALDDAARGRTTVVVAHRLSTIAGADQIIVLRDGRIVERGRHSDLIARDGEYAELWRRQAEEPEIVAAAPAPLRRPAFVGRPGLRDEEE
jgi:ATP-binding cassette subfamily B protein